MYLIGFIAGEVFTELDELPSADELIAKRWHHYEGLSEWQNKLYELGRRFGEVVG